MAGLALLGKEFGLDKMRFATVGVGDQDLLDHELRLIQLAGLRRRIDLTQTGLGLRKNQAKAQQGGYGKPLAEALQEGRQVEHGVGLWRVEHRTGAR